ncbi:MAG: hypothetical protein ACTSYL_11360 [Candidatus Thorarchaeota archaeon]
MNIEGVVIFESKSGIPLFSKMPGNTDPSLFASFITAARHFSTELSLGGLSSFATDEKVIFMSQGKRTVTVLITPKSQEFQEILELASEIGTLFESTFDIPERPQPHEYTSFRPTIEEMLRRVKDPFLRRVARFAHNEYGGEISTKARLTKQNGEIGIIDIMVNHVRSKAETDIQDYGELAIQNLSQDYTFVKAIDAIASRGEVIDFLDSVDHYGIRVIKRDEVKFLPYFPERAVVVARDFAEDVMDFITRFPTDNMGPYIDGSRVISGIKLRGSRRDIKCHIELWKWKDNGYPVRFVPPSSQKDSMAPENHL